MTAHREIAHCAAGLTLPGNSRDPTYHPLLGGQIGKCAASPCPLDSQGVSHKHFSTGSKKFLSMVDMPAWWSATFEDDNEAITVSTNETVNENVGGESDDKVSKEQTGAYTH